MVIVSYVLYLPLAGLDAPTPKPQSPVQFIIMIELNLMKLMAAG